MTETYSVIGPPGCGKTTYCARQARRAVEVHGPDGVLIASLTRAAAAEAAGRDSGVDADRIGTLHAHCYRGLDRPKLVSSKDLQAWNEEHPQWRLSGSSDDPLGGGKTYGDEILQRIEIHRHTERPQETWTTEEQSFHTAWTGWKGDLWDFTDLIEQAADQLPIAPGNPSVIFADEAQDHSALELRLLRQWARSTERLVLIGDSDQALFDWRGAAEDALVSEHRPRILSQSYRVPRAVHEVATRIVEPVEYHPTEERGEVIRMLQGYKQFEAYLSLLASWMESGETSMVLASCDYMLRPVLAVLRKHGIPYHNPYSDRWNPLSSGRGTSTSERLLAYLRPKLTDSFWTVSDLRKWVPMLQSRGNLTRGAKQRVQDLEDDLPPEQVRDLLNDILEPSGAAWIRRLDVDDLASQLTTQYQRTAAYPIEILRRRGPSALRDVEDERKRPDRVTVGTVHSVKGGEAHNVIVFPDLSPRGWQQYQRPGWRGRDAIRRVFYVAVTRAARRLVLGGPSGGLYASI